MRSLLHAVRVAFNTTAVRIICPIAWAGLIVFMSGTPGDDPLMENIIKPLYSFYQESIGQFVPIPYDKAMHLAIYAILGFLLFRARHPHRLRIGAWRWALIAIVLGVAFGVTDEAHQFFTPGRDASIWDWTADCVGVSIGALTMPVARFFHRREMFEEVTGVFSSD